MWVKVSNDLYLNLSQAKEIKVSLSEAMRREESGPWLQSADVVAVRQDGKDVLLFDLPYSENIEADVAAKLQNLDGLLEKAGQLWDLSK